jgi:pyruvate dehydrogenase E2 component (dihydrolipoyllysine-residue acetyltransferase)
MATLLRMPEISANMVEAVLSEWSLPENATFSAGDPIATVETEKAIAEVPAESDGVLLRILIEPGKSVSVGTPMAVLGAPGETVTDMDALVRRLTGVSAPEIAAMPADEPTPAGAREVSQSAEPASARPDEPPGPAVTTAVPTPARIPGSTDIPSAARVFASPIARRIAKENGIVVDAIPGTGPGGRVTRDDVRRALAARDPAAPVATAAPADEARFRDIPHSRMRRAIATRLAESHREMPVFSLRGSARVDELLALRRDLNQAAGVKVSLTDLLVAAAAQAHVEVPEMNVVWLPDAVRRFADVDIAVAVATDNGLVTPVVRGIQKLTISALGAVTADLATRARTGRLRQDELEGGTLTITNLGAFGIDDFTALINPPHAAILAVGGAREEAVVTDGALAVATVLRFTLSVDHRPVDGATAARWLAAFVALLQTPLRILA